MAGSVKASVEVTVARGRRALAAHRKPAGPRLPRSRARTRGEVGGLRGGRSRRAVCEVRGTRTRDASFWADKVDL